jgi:ribA/ribD-fused uncharacterized protein
MQDEQLLKDLCSEFNAGAKMKFVFFWGHQQKSNEVSASCFSQWYPASFSLNGERYLTAEHFMMAEKARLFGDVEVRSEVLKATNPGAAKALGRQVRGFDEATWLAHRYRTVVRANELKFSQNPELAEFLLKTGSRVLVEASPVDRIWGIGLAQDDERCADPNRWDGLNLLGFALMDVRASMMP